MNKLSTELTNHFIRGAVAGGLLSALQPSDKKRKSKKKKVLRHALQSGFAVSAGMGVANSLQQGNYQAALWTLVSGVVGIAGTELLLNDSTDIKEAK
jgi:hypothetical protein